MINLIESLQTTTKRNSKIKFLKEYRDDSQVKLLLFYTYNPTYIYFVKKIWKPEKIGHYSLLEKFSECIEVLEYLRKRYYTGHDALKMIKNFMETLDEKSQKVFELILKKDLKCGINVKTINKIWPDLIPEEEFQLAEPYNPEKKYDVDYWYWTPKLDGIRGRIDNIDNPITLGRSGLEINNTGLIVQSAKNIFNYMDLDFIDGEVYIPGEPFNKIMSVVSKRKFKDEEEKLKFLKEEVSRLQLWIFACMSKTVKTTKDMLNELENVKKIIQHKSLENMVIIPQLKIENDHRKIIETMNKVVNLGYEGIVLRHPEVPYVFKRDDHLIKVKPFYEADLEIYDFEIGPITMYEDEKPVQKETVTAIYVKGEAQDNKRKEFVYTRVGSGFTFEDRKDMYNNPDKYLGKLVEVEFQQITKNKDSRSNWSLRFAVFKRFRFDKKV